MKAYGLIGHPLSHSYSAKYFEEKFKLENINASYKLFDFSDLRELPVLINSSNLNGFNVTIPHKKSIVDYMTHLSDHALKIGAVNCVKVDGESLIGHNTDMLGFEQSLIAFIGNRYKGKGLVLGTGGSSLAVCYVLEKLGIEYQCVSRHHGLTYEMLTNSQIEESNLIINTTPAGMFPGVSEMPPLNLESIGVNHLIFDLIYNPEETRLLGLCRQKGAKVKNGLEMLKLQAEASWGIWNS